jgi:hypothetical protein
VPPPKISKFQPILMIYQGLISFGLFMSYSSEKINGVDRLFPLPLQESAMLQLFSRRQVV